MTKPVYAIRVYDPTPTLRYTISKDAWDIRTTEILTSNVGTFTFSLPTVKGVPNPYYYNDIAVNDIVKFWFGYDSVSPDVDTPDFVGRVQRIEGPLSNESGFIRVIKGRSQGEVLKRRHKAAKSWSTGASTIVTELATDLGILGAGDIEADATTVDLSIGVEPYFDVLRKVSDYYTAASQVKKDFAVMVDGHLHWKGRPWRSDPTEVESFTVGEDILSYQVTRDIDAVRNNITVYGAPDINYPSDFDDFTERDAAEDPESHGWSVVAGDDFAWFVAPNSIICGSEAVELFDETGALTEICAKHTLPSNLNCSKYGYNTLHLGLNFGNSAGNVETFRLTVDAPNLANSFYTEWHNSTGLDEDVWVEKTFPLGVMRGWEVTGNPNWADIDAIRLRIINSAAANLYIRCDKYYWAGKRYSDTASNAASQTAYERRDMIYVDDFLHSDTESQSRSEAFLWQLKDAPIRIDLAVLGNTNVLVGDRLSMTIPAESISAANYDVVSVTQSFDMNGFRTFASMVNSENIRQMPARSLTEILLNYIGLQREIGRGVEIIK